MTPAQETSEREQILEAEVARLTKRLNTLAIGFRVPDGGRYTADWQTRILEYQRLAALRAAGYAPAWQPIETAPTLVNVLCGAWIGNRWFQIVAEKVPAHANKWVSDSGVMTLRPTLWQPLPAPPATPRPNEQTRSSGPGEAS